jgi:hypothetical protein
MVCGVYLLLSQYTGYTVDGKINEEQCILAVNIVSKNETYLQHCNALTILTSKTSV